MFASGQPDPVDHFGKARRRGSVGVMAENFEIPPAAEIIIKNGALENGADAVQGMAAIGGDVETTDPDGSFRWPDLAEHHADGGAFSGAIVAEQAKNPA